MSIIQVLKILHIQTWCYSNVDTMHYYDENVTLYFMFVPIIRLLLLLL